MRGPLATKPPDPLGERAKNAPNNKGRKLGVGMKPKWYTVTALASLAMIGMTPAVAAQAQPAIAASESSYDAEIGAARAAMMADPQSALIHARAAALLSRNNQDAQARQIEEATCAWLEAEALMRVNRPQEARPAIDRGLAIVTEHAPRTKLHADLLRARAALSMVTGDVSSAHADLLAAREIFRALGETRSHAIVLQNLGSLYSEARDFERALAYFEESRRTHEGDPALTLSAHNNRGNAYKELGRFAEAEREFGLALEAARAMNSDLLEARILSNLASAQALRGDNAQAEMTVQLGLAIAQRSAPGWEPFLWGVRAQIALARHDLPTARAYIERTFAGVELDSSTMPYREFHETARLIYSNLGDATNASRHTTAFRRLDDQVRSIAASTSAALTTAQVTIAGNEGASGPVGGASGMATAELRR